ncbi:hypothetical protein IMZ48_41260 [Candidatus Bathyarchaeota archaeon]|nr:hypothetical protein [Candidatus Bathyarchaeota archaeon]
MCVTLFPPTPQPFFRPTSVRGYIGSQTNTTNTTQNGATYDRWTAYGQAKTANMLMALSLAEKLGEKGLHAFSLHPGVITTNLGSHVDWEAGELRESAPT